MRAVSRERRRAVLIGGGESGNGGSEVLKNGGGWVACFRLSMWIGGGTAATRGGLQVRKVSLPKNRIVSC